VLASVFLAIENKVSAYPITIASRIVNLLLGAELRYAALSSSPNIGGLVRAQVFNFGTLSLVGNDADLQEASIQTRRH
jgi:hypothetical protein